MRFNPAIWIKDGEFSLREVHTIEEAQEILDYHPDPHRGSLFTNASNKLIAAREGVIVPNEARLAFCKYAEDIGILAESCQRR